MTVTPIRRESSRRALDHAYRAVRYLRRFENEHIFQSVDAYGAETGRLYEFQCECGDIRCRQTIEMTAREYERWWGGQPLVAHTDSD